MYQNLWPDELKILVIDDEQDMLNMIRLSLEPAGFRVLRTADPQEGLSLALREQPDLLILDVMMPVLDGFELLRRLRRHPKVAQIPVIILSAQANPAAHHRTSQLSETREDGVEAYLAKPFNPGQLLKTVKDVLLKHREYLLEKRTARLKPWERQQVH